MTQHAGQDIRRLAAKAAPLTLLMALVGFPRHCLGEDQLTGAELLVELRSVSAGPAAPGVYAWSSENGWRRVVTHGRDPVWAPSHRQFACYCRDELLVVTVPDRRKTVVSQGVFYSSWLPDPIAPAPRRLGWLPDESGVFGWLYRPVPTVAEGAEGVAPRTARIPVVSWLDRSRPPRDPLVMVPADDIGLVSLAPDSRRLAFEHYRLVPGVGRSHVRVSLGEIGTAASEPLALSSEREAVVANPQWCPDNDRLAVDLCLDTGHRAIAIVDLATRQSELVPPLAAFYDWCAAVAWSPDGQALLTIQGPTSDTYVRHLVLVDCPAGGRPASRRRYGDGFVVQQAVWSRDGNRLALLTGSEPEASSGERLRLLICDRRGLQQEVSPPPGLCPVSIDW